MSTINGHLSAVEFRTALLDTQLSLGAGALKSSRHTPLGILPATPGLPADHVLTIIRIKQQQDRAALATSRTSDYTRGSKQRKHRAAGVRIVRVLDFERAFAMLEEEHQLALALICRRDNQPQDKAADAIGCNQCKLCYLLPEARPT
jgi:hypothetical protein